MRGFPNVLIRRAAAVVMIAGVAVTGVLLLRAGASRTPAPPSLAVSASPTPAGRGEGVEKSSGDRPRGAVVVGSTTLHSAGSRSVVRRAPVPRHPRRVLEAHGVTSPKVAEWFVNWERSLAGGESTTPDDLALLKSHLSPSDLPPEVYYELGSGISMLEGRASVAIPLYREAIERVARERASAESASQTPASADVASSGPASPDRRAEMLLAMLPPLWKDREAEALFSAHESLLALVPPGDRRRGWVELGYAHSLYQMGRYEQALAYTESLEAGGAKFTSEQLTEIEYAKGLQLYALRRPQEAVTHLRRASRVDGFLHAIDAKEALAYALSIAGDESAAEAAFEEWVRSSRPTARVAAEVIEGMRDAARAG